MYETIPTPMPDGASCWLGEEGEKKYTLLATALELREGFQLHIVGTPGRYVRDEVIRRLTTETQSIPPLEHLEVVELDKLVEVLLTLSEPPAAEGPGLIISATGLDDEVRAAWANMLQRFNLYRNNVTKAWKRAIILIGPSWLPVLVGDAAPDLWSIRLSSENFPDIPQEKSETSRFARDQSWLMAHELEGPDYYLDLAHALKDSNRNEDHLIRLGLLRKGAQALRYRGQLDTCLEVLRTALQVAHEMDSDHEIAVSQGQIADNYLDRAEYSKALEILRNELLPFFTKAGATEFQAATLGRIADIKARMGQPEDALKLYREEVLPIYMNLNDPHSLAILKGKVAAILKDTGEYEEAKRLIEEEVLPELRKHGDRREVALATSQLVDILMNRGDFEQALHTMENDVLPVFRALGDKRSESVALWSGALIQNALDRDFSIYLRGAYDLVSELGIHDGIATVGQAYGSVLCQQGHPEEGVAILEHSLRAHSVIGNTTKANEVKELIAEYAPASPKSDT